MISDILETHTTNGKFQFMPIYAWATFRLVPGLNRGLGKRSSGGGQSGNSPCATAQVIPCNNCSKEPTTLLPSPGLPNKSTVGARPPPPQVLETTLPPPTAGRPVRRPQLAGRAAAEPAAAGRRAAAARAIRGSDALWVVGGGVDLCIPSLLVSPPGGGEVGWVAGKLLQ